MKPVTVSVTVPIVRDDVYAFLDPIANHEPFTDHMMVDWSYFGPPRGVGAGARMRLRKPGRPDWIELEVIEAQRPWKSVERSVSAGGRRRTQGTYLLADAPGGGTRISFEFVWLAAPLIERLAAPVTRSIVRRGNRKALERLAAQLPPHGAAR